MCGRFSIDASRREIEEYYSAVFSDSDFAPRYNAAPEQELPVVLDKDQEQVQFAYWGLHPSWFKFQKGIINLKTETLRDKPFMRRYLKKRCLVPATGFFEWKKMSTTKKTPYRIFLKDRPLFSFAGVWEQKKNSSGDPQINFSLVTTKPNELTKNIHNRMPVILSKEEESGWLLSDAPDEYLLHFLNPYPEEQMDMYPVSTIVNNPANDVARVLYPKFG